MEKKTMERPIVEKGHFELYCSYFWKIKNLCIQAYKCDEITDEKFFIKNGIPEEFMAKCKKNHLYGGGKNNSNIYWNWHKNRKYPGNTIDNFLDFVEKKEKGEHGGN